MSTTQQALRGLTLPEQICTCRAYTDDGSIKLDFEKVDPPRSYPIASRGYMPFLMKHCKFKHVFNLQSTAFPARGYRPSNPSNLHHGPRCGYSYRDQVVANAGNQKFKRDLACPSCRSIPEVWRTDCRLFGWSIVSVIRAYFTLHFLQHRLTWTHQEEIIAAKRPYSTRSRWCGKFDSGLLISRCLTRLSEL
jgi:hypothetical protein